MVLYCKTSGRAAPARAMRDMGYLQVHSIAGGFDAWVAAGKPVAAPASPHSIDRVASAFPRSLRLCKQGPFRATTSEQANHHEHQPGNRGRVLRVLAGLVLIVALAATGTVGWWGWLGVVPLATGLFLLLPGLRCLASTPVP